jgi:hypothetical protein
VATDQEAEASLPPAHDGEAQARGIEASALSNLPDHHANQLSRCRWRRVLAMPLLGLIREFVPCSGHYDLHRSAARVVGWHLKAALRALLSEPAVVIW